MPTSSHRSSGVLLLAGAATFALYVMSHPQGAVDEATTVDEAVHSMAVESAWVPSHIVGIVALVIIAASIWRLLRAGWLDDDRRARPAAWLLFAGAIAAAVELVPHTFVASETTELALGGSTPLTDLHVFFGATLLPVYGLGIAALAATGFRRVAHPLACVLGVVGGAALTIVGPLLLVTGNPDFGAIYMAGGGTIVFLLATGYRLSRLRLLAEDDRDQLGLVAAGRRQPGVVGDGA